MKKTFSFSNNKPELVEGRTYLVELKDGSTVVGRYQGDDYWEYEDGNTFDTNDAKHWSLLKNN